MEFFIDTADVELIRKMNDIGLVDGVTTNPSLIKKAGRDHEQTIREISTFIKGPISVETLSEDAQGMVKEAEQYVTWGHNIVIKVVMTPEGMKALRELGKKGIRCNVTLVFSLNQALIAAKAGAAYVSPFVGRLDDIGQDGMQLIRDIVQSYRNYGFKSKVLVASVRSLDHVKQSALIGADVATIPPNILSEMFLHELTDAGIKKFLEDAKAWKK